jgi:hypothetical protein
MFYAYDKSKTTPFRSEKEANVAEWRRLTADRATEEDIEKVVYHYTIANMFKIPVKDVPPTDTMRNNTFVAWLRADRNRDAVDLLILAKQAEGIYKKRADKWWYPAKSELLNVDLQPILERALAGKSERLKDRCLLQAVRAAFRMKKYDLCLDLWKKQISKLPGSAVKRMCQGYIGGIYFRRGDYRNAIRHYSATKDRDSFWWCAKYLTKDNSEIERMKILYKYDPSTEELTKMMHLICQEAEIYANPKVFNNDKSGGKPEKRWKYGFPDYLENRYRYIALRDFALQVASENRSNNPAMWQYAASFLTFLDGNARLAENYIDKALDMKGTPFVKEKAKVLKLILNVYSLPFDENYEAAVLPQMKWLDSLIIRDINLKSTVCDWEDCYSNVSIRERYKDWITFSNISQYYPYDMMRKLMLGIMLPKYMQNGKYTESLLLAGMASERMCSLLNYGYTYDHSSDVFNLINLLPVENVIKYRQILKTGGSSEFEKFLSSKCYVNYDYINEIIGTKYLRQEKYSKAISYFSTVSEKYIESMGIYEYFRLDPFREVYQKRLFIKPTPAYKLNYAKQMLRLQNQMNTAANRKQKAEALLKYAIALKRSVTDGEAWALTKYYVGSEPGYYYYFEDPFKKQAQYARYYKQFEWEYALLKRSDNLSKQALKTSSDMEIQAQCFMVKEGILLSWVLDSWRDEDKENNYKTIYDRYRNTNAIQGFIAECDNFKSWYLSYRWE